MIKANTLTFEQIEPAFHKWAIHFCRKYPNRFEYWELINSAWLDGKVRFLPQSKIKLASGRIRYDMLDYMRGLSKGRVKQKMLNRGLRIPRFYNFSYTDSMSPIDGGDAFETTLVADSIDIEGKDLVGYFVNHPSLSRQEKLIMNARYIGGCSFAEIGTACGLTESRIFQLHTNLMARLRALDYTKITGRTECQQAKT